jgi:hypothetical protein
MRRTVMIGFLVAGISALLWALSRPPQPQVIGANPGAEYRESIKQMPILERPHRFGHFYGNTVRRVNQRRNRAGNAQPGENAPAPPAAPAPQAG